MLYFVLLLMLTGCTVVKVTKVTNENKNSDIKGIRYSLGKPFIKVTPASNGDGSYAVDVIYLPDQDQTYAVDSESYFAKNMMEITVDESGILKKIDWSGTNDALVSEAAKAAGNVTKADLEDIKKTNDEKEKEQKEKKKETENALKTLQATLDQKYTDKTIAENDLASMKKAFTGSLDTENNREKIRQGENLVFKLDTEIAALELKKAKAQASASGFNNPTPKGDQTAYGPVIYSIIEKPAQGAKGKATLELKAVTFSDASQQQKFATISKVAVPAAATTGSEAFDPLIKNYTIVYDAKGDGIMTVIFQKQIVDLDHESQSRITGHAEGIAKIKQTTTDRMTYVLKFNKADFIASNYNLSLVYSYLGPDGKLNIGRVGLTIKIQ